MYVIIEGKQVLFMKSIFILARLETAAVSRTVLKVYLQYIMILLHCQLFPNHAVNCYKFVHVILSL